MGEPVAQKTEETPVDSVKIKNETPESESTNAVVKTEPVIENKITETTTNKENTPKVKSISKERTSNNRNTSGSSTNSRQTHLSAHQPPTNLTVQPMNVQLPPNHNPYTNHNPHHPVTAHHMINPMTYHQVQISPQPHLMASRNPLIHQQQMHAAQQLHVQQMHHQQQQQQQQAAMRSKNNSGPVVSQKKDDKINSNKSIQSNSKIKMEAFKDLAECLKEISEMATSANQATSTDNDETSGSYVHLKIKKETVKKWSRMIEENSEFFKEMGLEGMFFQSDSVTAKSKENGAIKNKTEIEDKKSQNNNNNDDDA